ncbi:MAG: YckD family protein [Deltaproteobacteria bacterium]|jgi:hypothetical protein|nr:YckD family protein [Deltaproteobacteria bacterium]
MHKLQKEALQITKEIIVKFVEVGRITPANFADNFPAVYSVVLAAIAAHDLPEESGDDCKSASPSSRNVKPSRRAGSAASKIQDDTFIPPKVIVPGA